MFSWPGDWRYQRIHHGLTSIPDGDTMCRRKIQHGSLSFVSLGASIAKTWEHYGRIWGRKWKVRMISRLGKSIVQRKNQFVLKIWVQHLYVYATMVLATMMKLTLPASHHFYKRFWTVLSSPEVIISQNVVLSEQHWGTQNPLVLDMLQWRMRTVERKITGN